MTPISDRKLEALIKSSDSGDVKAQEEYGRIFDANESDPRFIERVCIARVNIYKDAAKRGDKNAILRLANALALLGYEKDAYNWYMSLINKGDTDAMVDLASHYNEYGCFGHKPDEEKKWLKLAANKGNAEAQCKMGLVCLCESDWYNALLWYELAAKQNDPNGKIGYAKCLNNQLDALYEYYKGFKEVVPGRYEYIRKNYGTLSQQQCRLIMRDLYWKIEGLFIEGLRKSNSRVYLSDAFSGLSLMYLYPKEVCEPAPYLAAFYRFEQDRVLDNKFAYDACLDIIKQNNLKVTAEDLKLWDQMDIVQWGKMRGIDVLIHEIPIPQSPQPTQKQKQPQPQKSQQQRPAKPQQTPQAQNQQPQISHTDRGQTDVAQQNSSTCFIEFVVKNSANPLSWANGSQYRFVVDGTREVIVVAGKGTVTVRKPLPGGRHSVYLEVYGDGDIAKQNKPLSKVDEQIFFAHSGQTIVVTSTRGNMFSATKIAISTKR